MGVTRGAEVFSGPATVEPRAERIVGGAPGEMLETFEMR